MVRGSMSPGINQAEYLYISVRIFIDKSITNVIPHAIFKFSSQ